MKMIEMNTNADETVIKLSIGLEIILLSKLEHFYVIDVTII